MACGQTICGQPHINIYLGCMTLSRQDHHVTLQWLRVRHWAPIPKESALALGTRLELFGDI